MAISIVIFITILAVIVLVFCVLYLVLVYRRLLAKYYDLTLAENKSSLKESIDKDSMKFVDAKIDRAIDKAISEAEEMVAKSAKSVVGSMKRKTLVKLEEDEKAEEAAISASFDEAREEIEKYKAERFEEMRQKANLALDEVVKEALGQALDRETQDKLVMKAINDAKRSKIF